MTKKLWQQDVLRYLTNRQKKKDGSDPGLPFGLRIPLKKVRTEIGLEGSDARLRDFVYRRNDIPYPKVPEAETIFSCLIQPQLDSRKILPDTALQNFHNFLRAEGIQDLWEGIPDYRECILTAFREGLARLSPSDAETEAILYSQEFPEPPFFTGRDEELRQLHEALKNKGAALLTGEEGIGKTTLAKEYARRNRDKYNVCQMIVAEPELTSFDELLLAADFGRKHSENSANREDLLQERFAALCALTGETLLIFDNLTKELTNDGLFRQFLHKTDARIIVTGALQDAFAEMPEIHIGVLSPDDQLKVLCSALGHGIREKDAGRALCTRAGGNTFLLGLVGHTMKCHKLPPAKALEKRGSLPGFTAGSGSAETGSTDSAADRVKSLIFKVKAPRKKAVKELLGLLAFLPVGGISRNLLMDVPLFIPDEALETAEALGWITIDSNGTVFCHPLVRSAALKNVSDRLYESGSLPAVLDNMHVESFIPESIYTLGIAAAFIDQLYIRADLRSFLVSERIQPLIAHFFNIVRSHPLWQAWLAEQEKENKTQAAVSGNPLDQYLAFSKYLRGIRNEEVSRICTKAEDDLSDMIAQFTGLSAASAPLNYEEDFFGDFDDDDFDEDDDDFDEEDEDFPFSGEDSFDEESEDAQQRITDALLSALELAVVLAKNAAKNSTGKISVPGTEKFTTLPNPFADLQTVLDPLSKGELAHLAALADMPASDFLLASLDDFSHFAVEAPFTVPDVLMSLAFLLSLQSLKTAATIGTLEEITRLRGWSTPEFTNLPAGLQQVSGPVIYDEDFWDNPSIFTLLTTREDVFDVHMTRKRHVEDDAEKAEEWDVTEETEAGTIYVSVRQTDDGYDDYNDVKIRVDAGPWEISIINIEGDMTRDQALQVARGIKLTGEERS